MREVEMVSGREPMSNKAFYGYMYPLQNRRYYLALFFSLLLFPIIAAGLIAGMITLVLPLAALVLWIGMRIVFAMMLGNSILVSNENFPRIHDIAEETKANLGYNKPIYIFVYQSGDFNAYMRHMFFRRAIFLNSDILQSGVSDTEVRWIVGRFVGYMRARRQGGVLGWLIRAAQKLIVFNLFILPYERAMVYTGDRLALAEVGGDIASAASAMQKLLVGRELGYSVNPEGIIAQHRQVKGSFFAFLARLPTGFPHTTSRFVDLILFAKAFFPEQYRIFEAANPGLPQDIERLGYWQGSKDGAPRRPKAPRGWLLAIFMVSVPVVIAVAMWSWASPETFYEVLFNLGLEDWWVPPPGETWTPAPPEVPDVQPAPPAATDLPAAPPNTHYNADGRLEPDPGCNWMSDDVTDLRVTC